MNICRWCIGAIHNSKILILFSDLLKRKKYTQVYKADVI